MRKHLSRYRFELLGLAIALTLASLHWWSDTRPVQQADRSESLGSVLLRSIQIFEGKASDAQFRLRGPKPPHPDVVVVAVDERSVQKYGRWPWARSTVAKALVKLHEAGVAAVGMDVIFTDEAPSDANVAFAEALKRFDEQAGAGPARVQLAGYRELLRARSEASPDAQLAAALKEAPEVVQGLILYPDSDRALFASKLEEQRRILAPHVISRLAGRSNHSIIESVPIDGPPMWSMYSAQTPLPALAEAGTHVGFFSMNPDPDGTMRRIPQFALVESPKGYLTSLALQTAAVYFGSGVEAVFDPDTGFIRGARLQREGDGPLIVPLQTTEPYSLINHVGPQEAFHTVSLGDVLDGKVGRAELEGKAVLLGITLVGNFDQRVTPFSEYEPGVYAQASFLSNILSEDFLQRPATLRLLELLFILGASLVLARVLPRRSFPVKLLVVALLAVGWLAVDQLLFVRGVQLATVLPVANVLVSSFGLIFLGYLSVDREKGRLRNTFQHYLNESVMEQMLQHPDKLKLGGEKKVMTVLFSDIRGFTTLSERMTPEALVKFINSYLTPMTGIVFEEGGTLDKYIGDALMAFWGAPIDQKDHALRACRAAVRMLEKLRELKLAWRDQNLPEFDIGVGINSGQMIVGNMGSDVRFDYTVMGDAVNLASRLEGTNKEYETRVLISEGTFEHVKGEVIARRLGAVRVKGKRKPVRIYELRGIGQAQGTEAEAIASFEAAVDAYTAQRFDEAEAAFNHVLTLWEDDPPCRRYLEEIASFRIQPPGPGWDGVYTATTK